MGCYDFIDTDDKITGGLRKSHNEALHDLYISPNLIQFINLITKIHKKCLAEQQQSCYWCDLINDVYWGDSTGLSNSTLNVVVLLV
jgi:hypothetical protein